MAAVQRWTGREARALRLALRMSVRAFADHLGLAPRTVSKWEKLLADTEPRPDTQAILDTALGRADVAVHLRFDALLTALVPTALVTDRAIAADGPPFWEYEPWADDLDRAVIALSRQEFAVAENLLQRWLARFELSALDDRGAYLLARSTTLLGDLRRDTGTLSGPMSAEHCYRRAHGLFARLHLPRRLAQLELLLVLVDEMSGRLAAASGRYERLSVDPRLSGRDRARSRLWHGRTLSKLGYSESAVTIMSGAAHAFEDLCEPADWSVTQQKIALARRAGGDLAGAMRHIGLSRSAGEGDSPLQRVRWSAAHGHVLVSDAATRNAGMIELRGAAETARRYGLGHQLRSIEAVRRSHGGLPTAPADRRGGEVESGSTSAGAGAARGH